MDSSTRAKRTLTYVLWMLGTAFIPVGLNFPFGSAFQVFFLSLGVGLFVLSRAISATLQTR